MKYGTPTTLKYLLPYKKGFKTSQSISKEAERRLKWMDYIDKGNSIRKTSRHFDIPESTIRYWRKRYNPYNLNTLENKSRKPHTPRKSQVPDSVVAYIIQIRQKIPGLGKDKVQRLLAKKGIFVGQSRIQIIINKAGLKRVKKKSRVRTRGNRKHMYSVPRNVLKQPGGLVYLDVKHLLLTGGNKGYQFTAIDHSTRMLCARVYSSISSKSGRDFFRYLDETYPFDRIQYIGTDNGSEFLGECEKELDRRGIKHVFSSPRSPKQNPFVERVIRTIIDEVYTYFGTEITVSEQQEVLDNYVKIYNEIRPHKSLELRTPLEEFDRLSKHSTAQHVPNSYNYYKFHWLHDKIKIN